MITCRLCGAQSLMPLFEALGQHLMRCGQCGYVQITERPSSEALDALYGAQYFVSSKYRDESTLLKENTRRAALLKRFLPANGKHLVLDAGCATGDFLAVVKSKFEVYGCDISKSAVSSALKKNPELVNRLRVADLEMQADFSDLSFDAICMWDVLEHLWDPVSVLASFSRMIKPGGFFFLSTPNIGAFVARIMGKRWAFMTPPEHMGFFSNQTIQVLLENKSAFTIRHMQSRGKWTNFGFVVHKLGRVFPSLASERFQRSFGNGVLGRLQLYVPSRDILYVVAQKKEKIES